MTENENDTDTENRTDAHETHGPESNTVNRAGGNARTNSTPNGGNRADANTRDRGNANGQVSASADVTDSADATGDERPLDDTALALRGADIEKSYGSSLPFTRSVEVLTGASIEAPQGAIVGIVGENGSGKSTLMKILAGVLDADAGTVETSGAVGWCPQETPLYDRLTVRETFELFGTAYGMDRAAIEEARLDLAARLGFQRFMDYRIENLSGGNRQKVNLGVSLMHDPDVLLLDEPYTGFDWDTYLAFWEFAEHLVECGTTIVIISHLINERERFDRIYELRDGRLHRQRQSEETGTTPSDGGHGTALGTESDRPSSAAPGTATGRSDGFVPAREREGGP